MNATVVADYGAMMAKLLSIQNGTKLTAIVGQSMVATMISITHAIFAITKATFVLIPIY